jgi:hypothetical protein
MPGSVASGTLCIRGHHTKFMARATWRLGLLHSEFKFFLSVNVRPPTHFLTSTLKFLFLVTWKVINGILIMKAKL